MGTKLGSFWNGFEKQAVFGNIRRLLGKAKSVVTGKETLYHNTTARNARKILKEGLIPGKKRGADYATDDAFLPFGEHAGKKSYLSMNPDKADMVGKTLYGPVYTKKFKKLLKKIPGSRAARMSKDIGQGRQDNRLGVAIATATPGSIKGVQLKFEVPKSALKKLNPEINPNTKWEVALGKNLDPKYITSVRGLKKR